MTDKEYNGWTNYPTWAVYTWLTSDEDTYSAAIDRARMGQSNLRLYVETWLLPTASLAADLAGWALESVNWPEVVLALLED